MPRTSFALLVLLLSVPALAQGVPLQLAHQGRLIDAEQAPLDGTHDLTFRVYDAPTDGTLLWEETVEESFTAGFYSTVLGADAEADPLDDGIFATPPVYLELTVDDGEPLLPRQAINSVPYALRAGTAENVEGGYVDATDIAIDGTPVIDSSGTWVGATPAVDWSDLSGVPSGMVDGVDADVLAGLSCADQGVAKFDQTSGLWACGTDDVLTSGDVLSFVDGATIALGAGSSMAGTTLATLTDLDWTLLTSVPAGFADDIDDDALATLGPSCLDGDRASWDAVVGAWVCAPEQVALSRIDAVTATTGQVLTYDGTSIGWETPATTANPPCTLTVFHESLNFAGVNCGATALGVRTLQAFVQIDAAFHQTCGIDGSGSVRCWGYNIYGQSTPPAGTFSQVSVGHEHACGIDGNSAVQCWGRNNVGQASPPAGTFTQVIAGSVDTCAIDSSGSVQCWGADGYGQSSTPTGTFIAVSVGVGHVCGIDNSSAIQCWGQNDFGQASPPAGAFTQVSAGSFHTCGIDAAGAIQCWGRNNYGQSTPPVGTFSQVDGGGGHTCGINNGGSVQCWGLDTSGQSTPPAGTFSSVSAGQSHTCVTVPGSGASGCWGDGSFGQLQSP